MISTKKKKKKNADITHPKNKGEEHEQHTSEVRIPI